MSDQAYAHERDAADWFAVERRGVMSVAERAAYQAWLSEPGNRAAMRRMHAHWTTLGQARSPQAEPFARRRDRAAMLAVTCAASVAICALSLGTSDNFWTALDWTGR